MHFSSCDFFTSLGILLVLGSLLRKPRCYFSSVFLLSCKELLLWSLTTALTVRLWLLLHVLSPVTLLSLFHTTTSFFFSFRFFFLKVVRDSFILNCLSPSVKRSKLSTLLLLPLLLGLPSLSFHPSAL